MTQCCENYFWGASHHQREKGRGAPRPELPCYGTPKTERTHTTPNTMYSPQKGKEPHPVEPHSAQEDGGPDTLSFRKFYFPSHSPTKEIWSKVNCNNFFGSHRTLESVFRGLLRDDRPHGARAKETTLMLRPVPSMRQIFFRAHLDGAGSPVFRRAPPAQRRSCCPAYGFKYFFRRRRLSFSSPHAKNVALESPA